MPRRWSPKTVTRQELRERAMPVDHTEKGFEQAIEDDPELDRKKATRAIARFVSLHQHHLAQKTEVMQAVLSRMERNENISNQFMSNEQLRALALELVMQQVYEHFREGESPAA